MFYPDNNLYGPTDVNSNYYYYNNYSNQYAYNYQPNSIGNYQYQPVSNPANFYQHQSCQYFQPHSNPIHNNYQLQDLSAANQINQKVSPSTESSENRNSILNESSEVSDNDEESEEACELQDDDDVSEASSDKQDIDIIDDIMMDPSETIVTEEKIKSNETLYKNQVFKTYLDFDEAFRKYCRQTYQIFAIRKSIKYNLDSDSDSTMPKDTPYKLVVFQCYRSRKESKSRGENIRPCQKYTGCGCKATIRLNLENRGQHQGLYKIKKFEIAHNHPVIKEHFLLHPKNRKLSSELITLAKNMLSTGSKISEVALFMSKESGNVILSKDLHNLNRELYQKSDIAKLQEIIDDQIKRDNGKNHFQYIQSEDQAEVYGIFYQNNFMRSVFKTYGRIMFIDGTYKINHNNYPCIVFVVVDHNRHSRIVAFALVACERLIILESILNFFKQLNDISHLEYVMIDKDLKEDSAIASCFQKAQVLYCFWHVDKTFKQRFKKETYHCAKEMMLAESEIEFNEKHSKFLQLELNNQKNIEYLEDNWLNCKDKWAKYLRFGCSLNMQETNNPVEVINKQIKSFSGKHSTSTMAKCLSSIFKYLKSSGINHVAVSCQESHIVKIQGDHPLVNEFYKFLPRYLGNWLTIEYDKSITENFSLLRTDNESIVSIKEEKYQISNLNDDNVTCSCYANSSLNLPCRHIFFTRNELKMTLFTEGMIPDRHKLRQGLVQVEDSNLNLVTTIPNIDNVKSFLTSRSMNQKDKFNAIIRASQELANIGKNLKQEKFESLLSDILKLKVSIRNELMQLDKNVEDDQNKTLECQTNIENNDDVADDITCSQSSQFSTVSTTSTASFDLSKKRLIEGISVGRKSRKKSTNTLSKGQISKYDATKRNTSEKRNSKTERGPFKTIFENRSFEFLRGALINCDMAEAVIKKNRLVDEEHIVVDHRKVSDRSFFLYQQYLKSSTEFKSFFTSDGLDQLESTLNSYKIHKTCAKCDTIFSAKDPIKVCGECFSLYNLSCAGVSGNLLLSKKFTCQQCKK